METVVFQKRSGIAAGPNLIQVVLIFVSLTTMETVAFPKESDIAAKPSLVQMVPLCQIALDPHLCLIGNYGNGGISIRE